MYFKKLDTLHQNILRNVRVETYLHEWKSGINNNINKYAKG
jgi:hypothetical protein